MMRKGHGKTDDGPSDPISRIVRAFLHSNLSIILIIFSILVGVASLLITPREEDPQIVVPLADIYVEFPGHAASEVEQIVATPLERMLYQIDGVEYVYSMSQDDQAIITVRFYVGQDRERSLVKLFKKLNENMDTVTPGVVGWVMKPVEIDDVPIVTLNLQSTDSDSHLLRRVAEELVERLSAVPNVSRAFVIGGEPRVMTVEMSPEQLRSHELSILEVLRSIRGANISIPGGEFQREDEVFEVETHSQVRNQQELGALVVGVHEGRPVFLRDVASIRDGAAEATSFVRHGWGPGRGFEHHHGGPGTIIGADVEESHAVETVGGSTSPSIPSVTIAIAKQKGANAVKVSEAVIGAAERLRAGVLPDNVELVVTRNSGLTADHKVNELVEALGVAIIIVILLLTLGLGWREALIVAVAVPVVFGLTLAVNQMFGYTINRVTLFALILALGLLVDDPIVDVENITRHFVERKRATRRIVLDAVSEIRPPLISATLAVIVSFLPMFFITGMMGPYMSPMALNVPVAMVMSMVVAFTITPWLTYQMLKGHYPNDESGMASDASPTESSISGHAAYDIETVQKTFLYRMFRPMMLPLLKTRFRAVVFLMLMALLTLGAMGLGALRMVPLKMLPFDNKNEFLVLVDMPEGTPRERTDALVRRLEQRIAAEPEVVDYASYVGVAGPIDFNGLVRHYYLRGEQHQAELRVNLVGKKNRRLQSHGIGLRLHDELTSIGALEHAIVRVVELPPGPPVIASLVGEITGEPDLTYEELMAAGDTLAERLRREPLVFEVDTTRETPAPKWIFVPDQEKAAISGISVEDIGRTLQASLGGDQSQVLRVENERNPLRVVFQLPREIRSSTADLAQLSVKSDAGKLILLSELGEWKLTHSNQTIYHKNLRRVVYVFAECAGRPPAECVIDVAADQMPAGPDFVSKDPPRPLNQRTYLSNGGGVGWSVNHGVSVAFSGEGEWKITLDVFRDLGLAFGAAMLMIYIILVAQTGSFMIPVIVMLAIPLTVLGVMPGFYLLNAFAGQSVGIYPDPVFFTATAMIGMIALSGIVTRDSIILVDFMSQAVDAGRPIFDAILESRVVRLRPILLTAGAALLSAVPITLDPIFSGLGWSLIFGLIASTVFTLFVIPVTYWLLHAGDAH